MECTEWPTMLNVIAPLSPAADIFGPAEMLGNKFLNPVPTFVTGAGRAGHMLRRLLFERRQGDPKHALGPFRTEPSIYTVPPVRGLRVTWMGHSSVLIEIDGVRILTDPSGASASPLSRLPARNDSILRRWCCKTCRRSTPCCSPMTTTTTWIAPRSSGLPSLLKGERTRFICSLGLRRYLESWGIPPQKITELNWGQTASLGQDCHITATPARHFSGRGLWRRNETLWSSFVIRGNQHNIFFGADSGMFSGFRSIGDAYGPFDLTMLEIGAYDADWPDIHMGPIHAAEAHVDLKGKLLLPIHWGLFNLAFHPWREPIERLITAAARQNLQLFLPSPGHPTEVTGANLHTYWWER